MALERKNRSMGICDAGAAPIGAAGESRSAIPDSTFGSPSPSSIAGNEALILELVRFVGRVASQGVHSPIDLALLDGAKQTFSALSEMCDDLDQESAANSLSSMELAIASFDPSEFAVGDLDDVGSDDDEPSKPRGRSKKKPTKKKAARKPAKKKSR